MNKKLRNRLLALGCLLIFLAIGAAFYVNWVVQKPFAVILFLTENLSPSTLAPARLYAGGADTRLQIERLAHLGLVTTHANDFAVSDSAAAASAIATGRKVNNRSLATGPGGAVVPTLMDIARERGRATGLVSNVSLTEATAAAFFARTPDPLNHDAIARQLVERPEMDVVLGGGAADFLPENKEGRRTDGRDLVLELRNKGYDIVRSPAELANTPAWRAPRVFGLFSNGNLGFAGEAAARSEPSLADMVLQAIRFLQYNPKGYFLVVDAGLVGKAAGQNEGERTLRELLALDEAVAIAQQYAGENALLVVAGKTSVGGLRLNGFPLRNDKGAGVLGMNAQGLASITWSTGPGSGTAQTPEGITATEPVAFKTAAAVGTAEDSIVASRGPGAEQLRGFLDNTDLFRVISLGL